MSAPRGRPRPFWYLRRRADIVRSDVDEELNLHLEMRIQALRSAGLSDEAARREALRQFGDLEYTRQYCRQQDCQKEERVQRGLMLGDLLQDLRIGMRSLLRAPMMTLTIVVTVGLGIGATTVIFAAVNAAILRPLPYTDPSRLVRIYTDAPPNKFRFSVADTALPPVLVTLPDGRQVRSDDPEVDDGLSAVLDRPVRLVSAVASPPKLDEVWPDIEGLAPEEFVASTRVGATEAGEDISEIPMAMFAPPGTFFDLSALHLLTTATLARLAELEPTAIFDARRYRPNFLVDVDASGFVENDWVGGTVALGHEVRAEVPLPTMRCVMTTLAQEDLPVDKATLRAIARHNRLEIPNFGTWACAGVYATVAAGGTVALGDAVTV